MRSIFRGHLRLGLLSVPVRVFAATDSAENFSFNQLHDKCGSRIKQKRWCEPCAAEVPLDHIVKGYEFSKGQYVKVTQDEIDAIKVASTQTINITNFVDAASIDPLQLDRPYYIGPDGSTGFGKQAFATLREAMGQRVGIGKIAMYGREHLVTVRAKGLGIVMQTMRPEELRSMEDIDDIQPCATNPDEVAMAEALVVQFAKPFDFSSFKDDYTEALKVMLDAKIKGQPYQPPAIPQSPAAASLMDALKASLTASTQQPQQTMTIPPVPASVDTVASGKKKPAKAQVIAAARAGSSRAKKVPA